MRYTLRHPTQGDSLGQIKEYAVLLTKFNIKPSST